MEKRKSDNPTTWQTITGSCAFFRSNSDGYFEIMGKIKNEEELPALLKNIEIKLMAMIERNHATINPVDENIPVVSVKPFMGTGLEKKKSNPEKSDPGRMRGVA